MCASVSERTKTLGTEHAFLVLAEVNQLMTKGRDIISFAIGQPDFNTPPAICNAAKAAIDAGHHGYTASAGIAELRTAVAGFHKRIRKLDYDPDDIVIAGGAKPFIMYTLMAVTDPGREHEVLYPNPGFPIYESQIRACGAKPVPLPLTEANAFSFDIDDLQRKLNRNTRLLILNSPHNPTGRTLTRPELEDIANVLADYPDCWVLSDEIYSRMVHDGAFHSLAQIDAMCERTVVVDGLSKSYAMTGWRLGYAANRQLAPYFSTWVTNTDSCASVISQWAGIEALNGDQSEHEQMMHSFTTRRDKIYELLNTLEGVKAKRPGGAFYIWPNVTELCQMTGMDDAEALRKSWLYDANVAVLADNQFGARSADGHYVRFSYATAEERIQTGIDRIRHWISQSKR